MNTIGLKIETKDDFTNCVKIIRRFYEISIGEIKKAILENKYIIECSYLEEQDIGNIIKLYKELCNDNIICKLYEHDRVTDVKFLENLIKSYNVINDEISKRIDLESE